MSTTNAILISMDQGIAKHAFFAENEAKEILAKLATAGQRGCILSTDMGDAKSHYNTSAQLRQRVAQAKQKIEIDTRIQSVLDRQGVPSDPTLRAKFHAAFWELSCYSI